jgi:hypothetical protein
MRQLAFGKPRADGAREGPQLRARGRSVRPS